MADEVSDFFRLAESEFAGLVTERGFREVKRNSDGVVGRPAYALIAWASSKTFVEVVLECPRPYIDVQFGALVGGTLPSTLDNEGRFHLSGLIVVRAHDERRAAKLGDIGGLRKGQIQRGLRDCAKALWELAGDVLADDHTVFRELAAFGQWQMSQYRSKYLAE